MNWKSSPAPRVSITVRRASRVSHSPSSLDQVMSHVEGWKYISLYKPGSEPRCGRPCSSGSSCWSYLRCSSFPNHRSTSCWPWWKPSSCSSTCAMSKRDGGGLERETSGSRPRRHHSYDAHWRLLFPVMFTKTSRGMRLPQRVHIALILKGSGEL